MKIFIGMVLNYLSRRQLSRRISPEIYYAVRRLQVDPTRTVRALIRAHAYLNGIPAWWVDGSRRLSRGAAGHQVSPQTARGAHVTRRRQLTAQLTYPSWSDRPDRPDRGTGGVRGRYGNLG